MVRLERYATETNKLIIRLHKLLTDRPSDSMQQKIHEQTVLLVDLFVSFEKLSICSFQLVPWLDGTSVKLCPNCAKKFNITRRQHHCRLCGSIMCHDCSRYLSIKDACKFSQGVLRTLHSVRLFANNFFIQKLV